MDNNNINKLEAIIFSEGGEMPTKKVLDALGISAEQLSDLVQWYNQASRGTVLVQDNNKVLMRVSGEYADMVDELRNNEVKSELSKAALEALAIVLYRGGSGTSASEVEQLRGVNSGYTLRQLTMRGLLNKHKHGMSYQYTPTTELLSFLGVTNIGSLPEIDAIRQKLKEFEENEESDK